MRSLLVGCVLAGLTVSAIPAVSGPGDEAVVRVVTEFQEGLAAHDLERIEPLMAADMVAFENGRRDDTWAGFRDNHMKPEFQGPPSEQEWELVRVRVSGEMAWAYTRTDLQVTRESGEKLDLLLWTVYVLEKREDGWKIVVLDWSLGRARRN